MKQQKHPNYYALLTLKGAEVKTPINLVGGAEKNKCRAWEVSARLRLDGYDFFLSGKFHGASVETEETAQANLNIHHIRMYVEGGKANDFLDYHRGSFKALMLGDGIYICPDFTSAINAEMRKLVTYNTNHYIGLPSDDEYAIINKLGYKRIVAW